MKAKNLKKILERVMDDSEVYVEVPPIDKDEAGHIKVSGIEIVSEKQITEHVIIEINERWTLVAKLLLLTPYGVTDHKRGYVPLCPDAMKDLFYYFTLPVERLKVRLPLVHSNLTRYLIKLVIDNQDIKDKIKHPNEFFRRSL